MKEAIEHLITSDAFRNISKFKNAQGGKYRMFLTSFNKEESKNGDALDFLSEQGYREEIKKQK